VDLEIFRADLVRSIPRSGCSNEWRPPFDLVIICKARIFQVAPSLSDEPTEFLIKDRRSLKRLLGLGVSVRVRDASTIWTFRAALTRAEIDGKPATRVRSSEESMGLRIRTISIRHGRVKISLANIVYNMKRARSFILTTEASAI
jgi:hypothetical protein